MARQATAWKLALAAMLLGFGRIPSHAAGVARPATVWGDGMADADGRCRLQLKAGTETPRGWNIDWGDGAVSDLPGDATVAEHQYAAAGLHTVQAWTTGAARLQAIPDYQEALLRSRPLAYFPFSAIQDGRIPELVAGLAGTACEGTALADGGAAPVLGQALRPGPGGGFRIPTAFRQEHNAFGIEFWLRLERAAGRQAVFSGAGDNAPQVFFDETRLCFELPQGGSASCDLAELPGDGRWHHYAISYERGWPFPHSSRVRFQADGRLRLMATLAAADPGACRYAGGLVGAAAGQDGRISAPLAGEIDELALYATELQPGHLRRRFEIASAEPPSLRIASGTPGAESFSIDQPIIRNEIKVLLDPAPQADNRPELVRAIKAAEPGTRLRLCDKNTGAPGGTFYFRSRGGTAPSGDWVAIPIVGKQDLEIDGGGARLVFSKLLVKNLQVENCTRVALRNFRCDIDQGFSRVAFWARLAAIVPEEQALAFRAVTGPEHRPDILPDNLGMWRWRPHDPETYRIVSGPHFDCGLYDGKPTRDPQDPSLWHLKLKAKPGDKLWKQLAEYQAGANFFLVNNAQFANSGIVGGGNHHLTLDNLSFHAVLGMVGLFGTTDHLWIRRCRIGPPEEQTVADRPLASASDGFHFHGCPGYFLFEDNDICLTDDDPISIKSPFYRNVKKAGERTLEGNLHGLRPGGEVELRQADLSPAGVRARIVSVQDPGGGKPRQITLDQPIPDPAKASFFLSDLNLGTGHWILRNNHFHDFYGRIMLYAGDGTAEGNCFDDTLFRIGTTVADWEVAGVPQNLLVRDNLFYDTWVESNIWAWNSPYGIFDGIVVRDNSIVGQARGRLAPGAKGREKPTDGSYNAGFGNPKAGLSLNYTRHAIVLGNLFEHTQASPDGKALFLVKKSEPVLEADNQDESSTPG